MTQHQLTQIAKWHAILCVGGVRSRTMIRRAKEPLTTYIDRVYTAVKKDALDWYDYDKADEEAGAFADRIESGDSILVEQFVDRFGEASLEELEASHA